MVEGISEPWSMGIIAAATCRACGEKSGELALRGVETRVECCLDCRKMVTSFRSRWRILDPKVCEQCGGTNLKPLSSHGEICGFEIGRNDLDCPACQRPQVEALLEATASFEDEYQDFFANGDKFHVVLVGPRHGVVLGILLVEVEAAPSDLIDNLCEVEVIDDQSCRTRFLRQLRSTSLAQIETLTVQVDGQPLTRHHLKALHELLHRDPPRYYKAWDEFLARPLLQQGPKADLCLEFDLSENPKFAYSGWDWAFYFASLYQFGCQGCGLQEVYDPELEQWIPIESTCWDWILGKDGRFRLEASQWPPCPQGDQCLHILQNPSTGKGLRRVGIYQQPQDSDRGLRLLWDLPVLADPQEPCPLTIRDIVAWPLVTPEEQAFQELLRVPLALWHAGQTQAAEAELTRSAQEANDPILYCRLACELAPRGAFHQLCGLFFQKSADLLLASYRSSDARYVV